MSCKWGKHEEEFLKSYYSSLGPQYCANSLARTVQAVHRKAHKMGLSNPDRSFNVNKDSILYFVSFEVEGITYYKLGITNNNPKARLGSDWNKFNFNLEWTIESDGKSVRNLEKQLLEENNRFLINTGVLISGNTETLTVFIDKPKE